MLDYAENFVSDAAIKAALDGLTAEGGILETPSLILLRNVGVSAGMIADDLEEATFTGYAAKTAVEFGPAWRRKSGEWVLSAPSAVFTLSGTTVTQTVTGWAIVNAAKTALYAYGSLAESKTLTQIGDGVQVSPEIVFRM